MSAIVAKARARHPSESCCYTLSIYWMSQRLGSRDEDDTPTPVRRCMMMNQHRPALPISPADKRTAVFY